MNNLINIVYCNFKDLFTLLRKVDDRFYFYAIILPAFLLIIKTLLHEFAHFFPNRKKTKDNVLLLRWIRDKTIFRYKDVSIVLTSKLKAGRLGRFDTPSFNELTDRELKKALIMGPIVDLTVTIMVFHSIMSATMILAGYSGAIVFWGGLFLGVIAGMFLFIITICSAKKGEDLYWYRNIDEFREEKEKEKRLKCN